MAALAWALSFMVTNANPRDLPVTWSMIRRTSLTWPCCSNRSWRSFSVVSKERFPTYSFIVFEFGKTKELQSRSRESGFKPPMSDAHLTIYRAVKLKQSNPISPHYHANRAEHKRSFQAMVILENCSGGLRKPNPTTLN